MSYTKRTCHDCGYKDIQPNMYRVEVTKRTGTSTTGFAKRSLFGALLGDQRSGRQVGKALFAPNKRVYHRTREVWKCGVCAGVVKQESNQSSEPARKSASFKDMFIGFFMLLLIVAFIEKMFFEDSVTPSEVATEEAEPFECLPGDLKTEDVVCYIGE